MYPDICVGDIQQIQQDLTVNDMTNALDFDFDAGELCLDYANTAEMHASQKPDESLHDFEDLVTWGQAAGLVAPGRAKDLRRIAREHVDEVYAFYGRAIGLREAIYGIFAQTAGEQMVNPEDLALLNQTLRQALPHLQVISSSMGFNWGWEDDPQALDQIIWPVARSAADLLTSNNLTRVRQCADDRGCGYLFMDTSRNRSRRWCSMESCGNRAKATRHYKKIRKTG